MRQLMALISPVQRPTPTGRRTNDALRGRDGEDVLIYTFQRVIPLVFFQIKSKDYRVWDRDTRTMTRCIPVGGPLFSYTQTEFLQLKNS